METIKISVLGSINYDCVAKADTLPRKGETVQGISFGTFVGGKGANQAVQLSLLGAEVFFIGKVGDDRIGSILKQSLIDRKINIDYIFTEKGSNSGASSINIDKYGCNTLIYVPGSNKTIREYEVEDAIDRIYNSDIFLTQNEINIDMVVHGLKKAKEGKAKTLLNPAPAIELPYEVYKFIDYIIPNEIEAEIYSGISLSNIQDYKKAASWFTNNGVKNVIITLGEKGSYYYNGINELYLPAFEIDPIDTTAAGDAFIGGIAYMIAKGYDISHSMKFASACGALATSRLGAQQSLASLREVTLFLEDAKLK